MYTVNRCCLHRLHGWVIWQLLTALVMHWAFKLCLAKGRGNRTFPALHDYRPTCTRLIDAAYIGYTDGSFGNSPNRMAALVWRCLLRLAPAYLVEFCGPTQSARSSRSLRSANQGLLRVPFARTSARQKRAFAVVGPSMWIGLPLSIRSLTRTLSRGLGGVVGLMRPMARADRGPRPVYYLPCSDLGQVVNLSLSVA